MKKFNNLNVFNNITTLPVVKKMSMGGGYSKKSKTLSNQEK